MSTKSRVSIRRTLFVWGHLLDWRLRREINSAQPGSLDILLNKATLRERLCEDSVTQFLIKRNRKVYVTFFDNHSREDCKYSSVLGKASFGERIDFEILEPAERMAINAVTCLSKLFCKAPNAGDNAGNNIYERQKKRTREVRRHEDRTFREAINGFPYKFLQRYTYDPRPFLLSFFLAHSKAHY